ncbi:MAG: c-type cytochrome [Bacteroidota bacterium]
MKKVLLALAVFAFILTSCGDSKKKEIEKEVETKVEETKEVVEEVKDDATVAADQLVSGEALYTSKTCASCHALDTKLVGPSTQEIAKVYKEKNGNIVQFLKGNDPAIVDTDPGQVAIMKANLDSFVKDMTNEELQAVAAYMRASIK